MYQVNVNGKKDFRIEGNNIDGQELAFDIIDVKDGEFHILLNNKSYTAIVCDMNPEDKTCIIRINGNDYEIKVQDKYDLLLQQLGMSDLKSKKVNIIKAPMPGLVLKMEKQTGDEIKKGEPVLILEAMKMENILKSPGDGRIKSILVKQGQAVEKNQVLVELE